MIIRRAKHTSTTSLYMYRIFYDSGVGGTKTGKFSNKTSIENGAMENKIYEYFQIISEELQRNILNENRGKYQQVYLFCLRKLDE